MWIFYVALIASAGSLHAFPQNNEPSRDVLSTSVRTPFTVDGFVFDGPADGRVTSTTLLPFTSPNAVSTSTANTMTGCLNSCPTTLEYNLVCGSDGVEYENPGRLKCAAICGVDVTVSHYGKCTSSATRG